MNTLEVIKLCIAAFMAGLLMEDIELRAVIEFIPVAGIAMVALSVYELLTLNHTRYWRNVGRKLHN